MPGRDIRRIIASGSTVRSPASEDGMQHVIRAAPVRDRSFARWPSLRRCRSALSAAFQQGSPERLLPPSDPAEQAAPGGSGLATATSCAIWVTAFAGCAQWMARGSRRGRGSRLCWSGVPDAGCICSRRWSACWMIPHGMRSELRNGARRARASFACRPAGCRFSRWASPRCSKAGPRSGVVALSEIVRLARG